MVGNKLDTTCNELVNTITLDVSSSAIQDLSGVQYFDNLQNFDAHSNLLQSLPPLPSGITLMNINDNDLTDLAVLPPGLSQLYCSSNHLSSLPAMPLSLNVLSAGQNELISLPTLPPGLSFLEVSDNQLTSLPGLPVALHNLIVSDNLLTVLPDLPPDLLSLICNNNFLTTIPALPASLTELKCAVNLLQSLPALSPNLHYLGCANNQLTALPALPPSLNTLSAHNNLLTALPPLPQPSFSCSFDISDNPIACLTTLPDSIQMIFCNTFITCMPNVPQASTFYNCSAPLPPLCSGNNDCIPYNVSGYSFEDLNNNCIMDAGEPPLAGRLISINGGQYYSYTDTNGYYTFYTGVPGVYQLSEVNPATNLWDLSCNGNLQSVIIIDAQDTFNNRNFPNQIVSYCAFLTVDVATPSQRLCYSGNSYSVSYCNQGTLTAFNSYIDIEFDPEVIPLSSTLPWTSVNGNIYRFDIGTIAPGSCSSFQIIDSVSCDAIIDQTACIKANIYPDTTCETVSPLWDFSDLQVSGECNASNDTVKFVVKNTGTGDMTSGTTVTIYEDDLLMGLATLQLDAGDSLVVMQSATGATYRIEAEQTFGHPGRSQPRSFQELCGSGPYSLNKIIPVIQDDADRWVEIDCHLITASFDPNFKSVQPSGVGPDHLVTPNDNLDYTLQFQNTGTDTAFNVLIIDTIEIQYLDITTIQPGSSRHQYNFSVEGANIVKFAFNNIHLPDSNVNEAASHGFVKYQIQQKAGNLPGTVINNFADIYFDYNDPVPTNTAFVTIADKDSIFIISDHSLLLQPGYSISVAPNPFETSLRFEIGGQGAAKNYTVRMYDLLGSEVYSSSKFHAASFTIIPAIATGGIYFYRIYDGNDLIGTGKLIRK
jgi:hypothetical protein